MRALALTMAMVVMTASVASAEVTSGPQVGPKLVAFGIVAPLLNAALGIAIAFALGMTKGDAFLFTLLCASSSYIVVPAAMRQAVPEANPGLFELLSLSVTFPFNISVGIPLYFTAISRLWG